MSISIASSVTAAELAAAGSAANSAVPVQRPAPVTNGSADTVKLSESQQVYQLYNQGQTVSQIASGLSLTVELVNSYLGIASGAS